MKKLYLAITMLIAFLAMDTMQMHGQEPGDINLLFVGRNEEASDADYQSDADLVAKFEEWGYNVTYIWNDDYGEADASIYEGQDAVFMNETVDSEDMTNFGVDHEYPLPIITLEGYCADDGRWNWIAPDGELEQSDEGTEDALSIIIKDNSHYITSVYDNNEEVAWSSAGSDYIADITPVSAAVTEIDVEDELATLAQHDDVPNVWNLFTVIEPGVRIVYWGLNHIGLDGGFGVGESFETDDFYTIVQRSAEWAYLRADEQVSVNEIKQDKYEMTAFPNPASDQVTLRFRTQQSENVEISMHDITGAEIGAVATKQTVAGNNFVKFDVSGYTPGVYLVKLDVAGEAQFEKLIIK